jgi:hypothetical protein
MGQLKRRLNEAIWRHFALLQPLLTRENYKKGVNAADQGDEVQKNSTRKHPHETGRGSTTHESWRCFDEHQNHAEHQSNQLEARQWARTVSAEVAREHNHQGMAAQVETQCLFHPE